MDVHHRGLRVEASPAFLAGGTRSPDKTPPTNASPPTITDIPSSTIKAPKRSFDVAFLMAPDDLSRKRQQHLRLVTTASLMQRFSPPQMSPIQIQSNGLESIARSLQHQRMIASAETESPFDLVVPSKSYKDAEIKHIDTPSEDRGFSYTKSAFTKVSSSKLELTVPIPASPSSVSSTISGGGVSPDLTYQESLSPPMMTNNRSPVPYVFPGKPAQPSLSYFANSIRTSNSASYIYGHTSRDKMETRSSPIEPNGFLGTYLRKSPPLDKLSNKRPGNLLYPSENLPFTYPFPGNFPPTASSVPAHSLLTAAANVTAALLPPSLAALTMPAQNVCAKCNVSFRMTSDLVYHMRSHHKSETTTIDSARRRREQDKLKCPVCNESFRERHHLTRHMTAHQDKEGDQEEEDVSETRRSSRTAVLTAQQK